MNFAPYTFEDEHLFLHTGQMTAPPPAPREPSRSRSQTWYAESQKLPSAQLIQQTLSYAKELERIV